MSRLISLLLLVVVLSGCAGGGSTAPVTSNPPGNPPAAPVPFRVETVIGNASFPVVIAFGPGGRIFYNELRTGQIRVVQNGVLLATPFATINVATTNERGLLGLTLDPQFASNHFVYAFFSRPEGGNRVVRFTESNNVGTNMVTLVDLPGNEHHNAGNIAFGPDGKLYVTLGDIDNPATAQDPNSPAGKILRFNPDGSVPGDNPFGAGNPAYNLGLRNSFDFTFHPQSGVIYASENGPNCDDEINRIVAGGNYGWRPNYPCGDTDPRFRAPLIRFTPPIAPSGITFYTGTVFPQFAAQLLMVDFNQGRIRRFAVDEARMGEIVSSEIVLDGGFGPLLDILQGPDGFIYFTSPTAIHRLVPQ